MGATDAVFYIAILIMSVVIHEVSHGFAAEYFGDKTARFAGRLTLNPIRHLDLFGSVLLPMIMYYSFGFVFGWAKPVPYNPENLSDRKWGTIWVAAAGVLANFFIAVFFGIGSRLIPIAHEVKQSILISFLSHNNTELSSLLSAGLMPKMFLIFFMIILVNLALAIFNLVPIPPLDGSKILFSFLPSRASSFVFAYEQYSLIVLIIFIAFFSQYLFPILSFLFTFITGLAF
jgi:Zn-dependent protease